MTAFTFPLASVGDGPLADMRLNALLKTVLCWHRVRHLIIKAEIPRQTAQGKREGSGMGHESFPPLNAPATGQQDSGRQPRTDSHELQRP